MKSRDLKVILRSACSVALSLAAGVAMAARPLQTDDAGTLDARECELEVGAERESADGVSTQAHSVALACGMGFNTQVAMTASRTKATGESASGYTLAGKTQLWQAPGKQAAAFSFGYAFSWDRAAGEASRRSETGLHALFTQPVATGNVHLNLGTVRDEIARSRTTVWGLAYENDEIELGGLDVAPMAELLGARGEKTRWNMGLRAQVLPDRLWLDASYSRSFGSHQPTAFGLGLKLAF